MAVMRFIFATEQTVAIKLMTINVFNMTVGHQIQEFFFINIPCATIFFVFI